MVRKIFMILILFLGTMVLPNSLISNEIKQLSNLPGASHQHLGENHPMPAMAAPIGFSGGHSPMKPWTLMFMYKYMRMSMNGNLLDGNKKINVSEATSYMMLPKKMTVDMHMFGLMLSVYKHLSINLMIPYLEIEMVMERRSNGTTLTRNTSGIGDMKVGAGWTFLNLGIHYFHLDLMLGIPTGSINEKNPDNSSQNLGYSMQIGSGSYELMPGVTYGGGVQALGMISWGLQFRTVFRLDKNSNDYRLGHRYQGNIYGAWKFIEYISLSLRLNLDIHDKVSGKDKSHPTTPTAPGLDPETMGHTMVNGLIGFNFYLSPILPKGFHSIIGIEGGVPFYQEYTGVRRGTDYMLTAGLKMGYTF